MPILEDSLVVIYRSDSNDCVGAGVLVAPELILTCAHVVNLACGREPGATGRPDGEISLRFHSSRETLLAATVATDAQSWTDPPAWRAEGADLCLLQLCSRPPGSASPGDICVRDDLIQRGFRAVGFPTDYEGDMDVARGEIVGRDEHGLYLLQPESGALATISAATKGRFWHGEQRVAGVIHTGFSGAPVEVDGRVVGLITASRRPSEATGYMIAAASFPKCLQARAWRPQDKAALTIQRISDVDVQEEDFWAALKLYDARLPPSERYDDAILVDMIRHHLSGEFGPRRPSAAWRAYLLVAKHGQDVVGMLLGYDDTRSRFLYIPYLVVRKPRRRGLNPEDVSRSLVRELARVQRSSNEQWQKSRFLCEVDDPEETEDPHEKIKRRARMALFGKLAAFSKLQLRCIDFKFIQPNLDPWGHSPESRLRILYGVEHPPRFLPREELLEVLNWFYTQLYAANMFEDPDEEREYQLYLDKLRRRATEALPERVCLLRLQEL